MQDDPLKIPHVQRVRRGDQVHLYFRKGDYREGPLLSADCTPELKAEVDVILAKLARNKAARQRPKAGTVGGMLADYNRSADFLTLARSTQYQWQYLIDELTIVAGDVLLAEVTRAWLIDMRDAWARRGHRAANLRLQVLKNALAPAILDETDHRIAGDPFVKLNKVRRPHDAGEAHPIWQDDEVDAAIEAAITRRQPGLARAIALGRYGGFRRGTICAIPRQARVVRPQETRLNWITEKRLVLCDKREDPRLTELLARTPNRALTIAYNADGHPWKWRTLDQAFNRLMTALAKDGKVRAATGDDGKIGCPLTLHGLRHSRGVELAQAGASDAEIMTQLEHASPRQAAEYRRQADRRQLADTAQDKVDNVVRLRGADKTKAAANGA